MFGQRISHCLKVLRADFCSISFSSSPQYSCNSFFSHDSAIPFSGHSIPCFCTDPSASPPPPFQARTHKSQISQGYRWHVGSWAAGNCNSGPFLLLRTLLSSEQLSSCLAHPSPSHWWNSVRMCLASPEHSPLQANSFAICRSAPASTVIPCSSQRLGNPGYHQQLEKTPPDLSPDLE